MVFTKRIPTVVSFVKKTAFTNLRNYSGSVSSRCNEIFENEQRRQLENVGREEKIEVRYLGLPEDVTLIMNRAISTPFNCAQHLTESHCKNSALALIDGTIPWDMHRPLQESCNLQLLNFNIADPYEVNKAFWRSCSFMLGAALRNCFKEAVNLQLHSFPGPNIKTGSFVYDIVLPIKSWKPTLKELRTISAEMIKLAYQDLKFERLEIDKELAVEMFRESRYKFKQIPSILKQNQGRITVYRMGNHIDISRGPMVGSTRFIGKCAITAAHELTNKIDDNNTFYRIQGIALPTNFIVNHVAYNIIEERSKKLNLSRLPMELCEEKEKTLSI